ncbi:MAG: serine/threonine protein kinase, partial [Planctomycetales bacterium]|nr:serine/threonine protein kinase [Planctomycetales bacterium]
MMILICPCCGAESSERDQAQGRCGKCGSFFSGQEVVVDAPLSLDPSLAAGPPGLGEDGSIRTAADSTEVPAANSPTPVDDEAPAVFEPPSPPAPAEEEDSESLVRPRRLSPQFRRHVEMTWQPSLASNERNAERTLSAHAASDSTKHDHSTLSIGTRKITPDQTRGSGDYVLNDVIGEGSMGRVWSARQTSLDRNVAVKVPRPELASAGSVGEGQFISEVVVTGKLEHPNIVPIYELGRDTNGLPFYSMKHVQGRPWNELIADKSERENIEILMKVCDAIAFAHDRDFLHRDIKPHNVMVGEFGEVSVMDWGIAVSLSRDPTRAWAAVASGPAGTPAYMAPEMAAFNPSELVVVSDVYLLGAVLYEIVTGTPPHPRTGDTNEALLAAA